MDRIFGLNYENVTIYEAMALQEVRDTFFTGLP